MQWKNEIEAHSDGLDVLVWHGASRDNDAKVLKKYDVVLTTYAVMESCFRKQQSGFKRKGMIVKEKSVLHGIQWNRVIVRSILSYSAAWLALTPSHSWTRLTTSKSVRLTPLRRPSS